MVRRLTAREKLVDEESLRQCIRPVFWRCVSWPCEQVTHTRSEILLGVLQYLRHTLSKPGWALRKHQTALKQESTQLVDDRSSSGDEAIAYTMKCLQIELVICLHPGSRSCSTSQMASRTEPG